MATAASKTIRCFLRVVSQRKNSLKNRSHSLSALLFSLLLTASAFGQANQQFILQTAAAGATISGSIPTYSSSFGNLDAFGVGTPASGVTGIRLINGELYYTPINFVMGNLQGHHKGVINAYVSTNFTHPTAMILQACPSNGTCTSSAGYSTLSTSAAAQTTIIPVMPELSTATAYIAIFIPDNNGAGAFSGTDSATITFVGRDAQNGNALNTVTLSFNSQSVVTALQLTLSSATGGVTINPAADYSLDFGTVDGLGVAVSAGLTVVPTGSGVIYSTPYVLNPAFSNFTSTTGTIKAAVSTNFAHPAVLSLQTANAAAGPYSPISTTLASPTVLATSVASRAVITSYLGLQVSAVNGGTAFNGTDSATLTFTLTVP